MIQTFDFNGAGRQVDATGQFFRYEHGGSTDGNAAIAVRADGQDLGVYLPGDALEMPAPAKVWEIRPRSPQAFGTIKVGQSRVKTSRLHGQIAVSRDSWANTLRNRAFVYQEFSATTAAQYSETQIWNPLASNRALVFKHITWRCNDYNPMQLQVSNVMAPVIKPGALSALNGRTAASVGALHEIRHWVPGRSSVPFPFGALRMMPTTNPIGNQEFADPIVVLPGNGLEMSIEAYGLGNQQWGVIVSYLEIPLSDLHL